MLTLEITLPLRKCVRRKNMNRIGLVQMDGKLPNIALMRLGSHYKTLGDDVEWWTGPLFEYEKVFASKIFSFTEDNLPDYVIRGGTGVGIEIELPGDVADEHGRGWFLYPDYHNHIGFSERGCRLKCSFCVVPEKEGKPREVATIAQLLSNPRGEDRLVLLDDDFLGHPNCEDVFQELIDRRLRVCFSQGLNIRIITERQAELLARVSFWNTNFTKPQVSFAWDRPKDRKSVMLGFERCVSAGIKPYRMQLFILVGYDSTPDEDMERIETIRSWGADPFVMAYDKTKPYQKILQRWVNRRAIFNSVKWSEYRVHYRSKSLAYLREG